MASATRPTRLLPRAPRPLRPVPALLCFLVLLAPALARGGGSTNVVLVTVDTLRSDRLGAYGYHRNTTPHLDRFLARGARFADARTVEPLTNPSLASMLTSLYPHEHGSTRNGIPIRSGLPSLARSLGERGYVTAAFVGNWTLKRDISGLDRHFGTYEEVFSRKRWLLLKGEATARDLTDEALAWLDDRLETRPDRPFFLWLHYTEPHAPYRLQDVVLPQLGFAPNTSELGPRDRYDTEVAFVDAAIGRFLEALDRRSEPGDTLVVFTSDHGESLGEHGYWGHGRHLYDEGLRIPMGIVWPERVPARTVVGQLASILDLTPTVLGLLGHPSPPRLRGFDWSQVLAGSGSPPEHRALLFQAHKGAVQAVERSERARRRGLLEVAVLRDGRKEIVHLENGRHRVFDLRQDPRELRNLAAGESQPAPALASWRRVVEKGLVVADRLPTPDVDEETEEQMRALGYLD
jgi:arylsulfatase A-like enzyme